MAALAAAPAFAADQTLFTTQVPALKRSSDGANINYELGMKFTATVSGKIKAIRFYKSPRERGAHIGRIFSTNGAQLASVKFTGETASGWQQQALSVPLDIAADTQYVVSVNTAGTYYVDTINGFARQIVNKDLRSADGSAGVFGPVGVRPTSSYQKSNYFRDVVFAAGSITQPTLPPVADTTAPAVSNVVMPPPVPGTKPIAANTGWQPTGVTLSPAGSINITKDGTVVDAKDVAGQIIIAASNVTIKRSRIRTGTYFPILVKSGKNVVIEDCEVDGMGSSSKGILIEGDAGVTVQRVNIHDSEDGLSLNGNGGIVLRDSYIHSPRHSSEGHSDGFEIYGGAHMLIQNNNFDYIGATTSASNLSNWGGPIDDITYDGNWLAGGAYNFYIDGNFDGGKISNVRVTNNRFIRNSSLYGQGLVRGNLQNITWTGNVFDDNNAPVE